MLKSLFERLSSGHSARHQSRLESSLPDLLREQRQELHDRLAAARPKILVVKQDVNEDLYCCPPQAGRAELIASTLLRTGPVALFTELGADFRILKTVDDPECQIWQERATVLKWDSLEFFSSYRDRIPGRDYGQGRWAVDPADIDFTQYDIVISIDVSVPSRVTRRFPEVLWCYYVREIKAPSYAASNDAAVAGQDVVLNHHFRFEKPVLPAHVLEFPYHLHRPGCFHELFEQPDLSVPQRQGIFVDHHTMVDVSSERREALNQFGPVASTLHRGDREIIPTSERLARRTMDEDLRQRLLNSRYFLITPGRRRVFGTAVVEAIAAGCLVIGSPESLGRHAFLFTSRTTTANADHAVSTIAGLEADPELADRERERQRQLVEYLCFVRPVHDLLDAWQKKRSLA